MSVLLVVDVFSFTFLPPRADVFGWFKLKFLVGAWLYFGSASF